MSSAVAEAASTGKDLPAILRETITNHSLRAVLLEAQRDCSRARLCPGPGEQRHVMEPSLMDGQGWDGGE